MCVRPMRVKDNVVPCGKCFECKNADRNAWSIRLQHEIKTGSFVTLTYDDEHIPGSSWKGENHYILNKQHLINYIKRVREELRKYGKINLKYFGVGEYGTKHGRPHYHIIINTDNSNVLKDKWKYGIIHIGNISNSSIHYTTKYVTKESGYKKDQQRPKETREFRIMSKGIGKAYLKTFGEHHFKNKLLYLMVNNKKYPLPRYYMNELFGGKIKKTIDKETGEITTHLIREPTDLRAEKEARQLKKLKQLAELYKNMLHSEIEDNLRAKYLKYNKMYETLKMLKDGTQI